MPIADLTHSRLYYQLIGQGRPVVFVNDWIISCQYWLPLVEKLKQDYTCLLYDGRGFGHSPILTKDAIVDMDDQVEDLHALINKLNLKDVNLVGHGLGAWIALICARRHPQDTITVTMVAPEAELSDKEQPLPSIWQKASLLLKDLATLPLLRDLLVWRYHSAPEPFRTNFFADFAKADRRAAYHLLASVMGKDNQQYLRRILAETALPIMLVRGGEDDLSPEATFRSFFTIIKSGKMATIRGCGHLPMLEYTNELAKLLADFFLKNTRPITHILAQN